MDQVVVQPWIPQDDLLLKNAVEAGASLESLAKGAVRFSRKYSVAELRERWRSLLYDSDVSAAASASMVNLELSGKSGGSGSKEEEQQVKVGRKRKGMSIREQYYSRKKAFCRQVFFDSFDMAMHDEMNLEKNDGVELGRVGDLSEDMNHLIVSNLVKYGNHLGLEEVGPSHSMSEVPLWRTIEDVSAPDMLAMPAIPVHERPENENDGREVRTVVSHGLTEKCVSDELNASAAVLSGEDGGHSSDPILNLKNEDEPTFMDIDGKDAADKPCYVNVDSLILSTPREIHRNDVSDILESQKLHAETKLAVTSRSSATGLEIGSNPLHCSHSDLISISDPVSDCQSSAAAQNPHPEQNEKSMICVLSTEDPDVPSNDGVYLSTVVPHLETLKHQPIIKEVGHSDSSISNQRKNEPGRSLKKIPSHSFVASQIVRPAPVPNISSSQPPLGVLVTTENPGWNPIPAASRQSDNGNINLSHSRLVHAPITPALVVKQEEIDTCASAEVCAHPRAKEHKDLPKSETKLLSLNQEGDDDDNEDDDDDDDDYDNEIPYFSDAETMILEMDLCPTDQDSNASREVLRYQDEKTKRTIMRLEQCTESSMHRAIASHGALAVLYGRRSKQYIKKSKVILGRATDDVPVDIDLGREGPANKISRRQALIKMESDGSFIIQNLGKSPIFLNGKEVATGKQRVLTACSLIEIRGMSFIFDCNNKSVRSFLENVNKKDRR